ncbi:Xaa-Pro aminopeptidase [Bryocella elongata]|uniref:Xaa-Pro aminopeptidase n=1 Tax=Bryocella elongata TaxID=863522 RepID=A0A1H5UMV0_9BACT|nr:aminopeptidase P family protein [Bryocella elongata]SEF75768.1 Xaa-Pro aminopeptidase [Bryocella elongata]
MHEVDRRRQALESALAAGAGGVLASHAPDVRWLTGFTGSSGAVAIAPAPLKRGSRSAPRAVLLTDGRYTEQAKVEAPGLKIVIERKAPATLAAAWLSLQGVTKAAYDSAQTTVAQLEAMKLAVPGNIRRSFFAAQPGLVARLREVKDAPEIVRMRKAAALGCRLFDSILPQIVPGVPEAEIALALEVEARRSGAEAMSFETIVASGPRSSRPHHRAGVDKLPKRGFVTLDFGVILGGYCSDMTRTVHLGKASQRERDVYHSVLEAQQAAVRAVRPGVTCGEVDEAAREVLRRAKLAKAFSHSTGHGVGLEIHEGPRIATGQKQELQPGMVITIEPGAYLAGEFGVRIEDMVLVTESGHEVLTEASPKAWIEL